MQALQVAQHLVLGVVAVEHGVRQDGVVTAYRGRQQRVFLTNLGIQCVDIDGDVGEEADQRGDVLAGCRFVESHAKDAAAHLPQVVTGLKRGVIDGTGLGAKVEP